MIKYLAPASPAAGTPKPSPSPPSVTQEPQMPSPITATPEQVRASAQEVKLFTALLFAKGSPFHRSQWIKQSLAHKLIKISQLDDSSVVCCVCWVFLNYLLFKWPSVLSDRPAAQWAGRSERKHQSDVRDANRDGAWPGRPLWPRTASGQRHVNTLGGLS